MRKTVSFNNSEEAEQDRSLGCSDTANNCTSHSETAGLANSTALRETQLI
jgi:hypothetical protein